MFGEKKLKKRIEFLNQTTYNFLGNMKYGGFAMQKKPITTETYIVLGLFVLIFTVFSFEMGVANFLSTMIKTGYYLLVEVAFWIMGVAVLTGAMAGIFSEFGVIALFNKLLGPIVRVIYRLPGVAGIGAASAYLSDNPAVISLYKEKEFRKQFKPYQIPVLDKA